MREMFGRDVSAQEYDRLPLGVEGEERAQVTAEGGQLFHVDVGEAKCMHVRNAIIGCHEGCGSKEQCQEHALV